MLNIERRIAALEASTSDSTLKIIVVKDGETQANALTLAGLPPDALRVLYISGLDVEL